MAKRLIGTIVRSDRKQPTPPPRKCRACGGDIIPGRQVDHAACIAFALGEIRKEKSR